VIWSEPGFAIRVREREGDIARELELELRGILLTVRWSAGTLSVEVRGAQRLRIEERELEPPWYLRLSELERCVRADGVGETVVYIVNSIAREVGYLLGAW